MNYTLITGASSGIGKEIARLLANKGKNLILLSRRLEKLEEIKSTLASNVDVQCVKGDLSKIENIDGIFSSLSKFDIDVVINNAGVGSFELMHEPDEAWDINMINLNITALTILMQRFLAIFVKKDKGMILNVSSLGAKATFPGAAVYVGTKHYVTSLTMSTHYELVEMGSNVKVKVLEPGATGSDFFATSNVTVDREKLGKAFQTVYNPEEVSTSEQVAEFALELMNSDKVLGMIRGTNKTLETPAVNVVSHVAKAIIKTKKM